MVLHRIRADRGHGAVRPLPGPTLHGFAAKAGPAKKSPTSLGRYETGDLVGEIRLFTAPPYGTSNSLPRVLRLSMSAWAFAASASRY
jgi:hypothetical protein